MKSGRGTNRVIADFYHDRKMAGEAKLPASSRRSQRQRWPWRIGCDLSTRARRKGARMEPRRAGLDLTRALLENLG